jgi:hypothetical protein
MSQLSHHAARAKDGRNPVEKSLAHASPVIEFLARAGYAAKGVVYCIVGGLAVLAAFGKSNGQTTGTRGAIHTLLDRPAGVVLVSLLAVGLAGYALWCIIQALLDPDHKGDSPKRIAIRIGYFFKGLVHAGLVVAAIGMVTGRESGGDGESNMERWTAKLMSLPAGIWLVGILGASVVAYGVFQLYRAWKVKLDSMLALGQMEPNARRPAVVVSRFGIAARGVVFVVIGVALVIAALHANPDEAKGFGGALQTVANQPYGPYLLAVTAAGLIAYGLYEFLRAKYRIIHPA